eukprot:349707-Chlamydomonas_euryale.AAC.10
MSGVPATWPHPRKVAPCMLPPPQPTSHECAAVTGTPLCLRTTSPWLHRIESFLLEPAFADPQTGSTGRPFWNGHTREYHGQRPSTAEQKAGGEARQPCARAAARQQQGACGVEDTTARQLALHAWPAPLPLVGPARPHWERAQSPAKPLRYSKTSCPFSPKKHPKQPPGALVRLLLPRRHLGLLACPAALGLRACPRLRTAAAAAGSGLPLSSSLRLWKPSGLASGRVPSKLPSAPGSLQRVHGVLVQQPRQRRRHVAVGERRDLQRRGCLAVEPHRVARAAAARGRRRARRHAARLASAARRQRWLRRGTVVVWRQNTTGRGNRGGCLGPALAHGRLGARPVTVAKATASADAARDAAPSPTSAAAAFEAAGRPFFEADALGAVAGSASPAAAPSAAAVAMTTALAGSLRAAVALTPAAGAALEPLKLAFFADDLWAADDLRAAEDGGAPPPPALSAAPRAPAAARERRALSCCGATTACLAGCSASSSGPAGSSAGGAADGAAGCATDSATGVATGCAVGGGTGGAAGCATGCAANGGTAADSPPWSTKRSFFVDSGGGREAPAAAGFFIADFGPTLSGGVPTAPRGCGGVAAADGPGAGGIAGRRCCGGGISDTGCGGGSAVVALCTTAAAGAAAAACTSASRLASSVARFARAAASCAAARSLAAASRFLAAASAARCSTAASRASSAATADASSASLAAASSARRCCCLRAWESACVWGGGGEGSIYKAEFQVLMTK